MAGKHVVNVTVEADVLVGPLLRQMADRAGLIYSLVYGDQPGNIEELYDWAVSVGFEVVAAGKGTKYLPEYRKVKEKAGSFLDLCYTPRYAIEVTLQPIRRYGFDAAIVFSGAREVAPLCAITCGVFCE